MPPRSSDSSVTIDQVLSDIENLTIDDLAHLSVDSKQSRSIANINSVLEDFELLIGSADADVVLKTISSELRDNIEFLSKELLAKLEILASYLNTNAQDKKIKSQFTELLELIMAIRSENHIEISPVDRMENLRFLKAIFNKSIEIKDEIRIEVLLKRHQQYRDELDESDEKYSINESLMLLLQAEVASPAERLNAYQEKYTMVESQLYGSDYEESPLIVTTSSTHQMAAVMGDWNRCCDHIYLVDDMGNERTVRDWVDEDNEFSYHKGLKRDLFEDQDEFVHFIRKHFGDELARYVLQEFHQGNLLNPLMTAAASQPNYVPDGTFISSANDDFLGEKNQIRKTVIAKTKTGLLLTETVKQRECCDREQNTFDNKSAIVDAYKARLVLNVDCSETAKNINRGEPKITVLENKIIYGSDEVKRLLAKGSLRSVVDQVSSVSCEALTKWAVPMKDKDSNAPVDDVINKLKSFINIIKYANGLKPSDTSERLSELCLQELLKNPEILTDEFVAIVGYIALHLEEKDDKFDMTEFLRSAVAAKQTFNPDYSIPDINTLSSLSRERYVLNGNLYVSQCTLEKYEKIDAPNENELHVIKKLKKLIVFLQDESKSIAERNAAYDNFDPSRSKHIAKNLLRSILSPVAPRFEMETPTVAVDTIPLKMTVVELSDVVAKLSAISEIEISKLAILAKQAGGIDRVNKKDYPEFIRDGLEILKHYDLKSTDLSDPDLNDLMPTLCALQNVFAESDQLLMQSLLLQKTPEKTDAAEKKLATCAQLIPLMESYSERITNILAFIKDNVNTDDLARMKVLNLPLDSNLDKYPPSIVSAFNQIKECTSSFLTDYGRIRGKTLGTDELLPLMINGMPNNPALLSPEVIGTLNSLYPVRDSGETACMLMNFIAPAQYAAKQLNPTLEAELIRAERQLQNVLEPKIKEYEPDGKLQPTVTKLHTECMLFVSYLHTINNTNTDIGGYEKDNETLFDNNTLINIIRKLEEILEDPCRKNSEKLELFKDNYTVAKELMTRNKNVVICKLFKNMVDNLLEPKAATRLDGRMGRSF